MPANPIMRQERSMNWRRVLFSLMRVHPPQASLRMMAIRRLGGPATREKTLISRRTGSAARIRPFESTARWMWMQLRIKVLRADDGEQLAVGLVHLHPRDHLLAGDDLPVRARGPGSPDCSNRRSPSGSLMPNFPNEPSGEPSSAQAVT